jgi:hypothetical protein
LLTLRKYETVLAETKVLGFGHDDMIYHRDAEQLTGVDQFLGRGNVLVARDRQSRRVIMCHDNLSRAIGYGLSEYLPGMYRYAIERPDEYRAACNELFVAGERQAQDMLLPLGSDITERCENSSLRRQCSHAY